VTPGTIDLSHDAGLAGLTGLASASLGDLVWKDRNRNGLQDAAEVGVTGVTVNVYRVAAGATSVPTGTLPTAQTTTGIDGIYGFEALDPGRYCIEFKLPAGFVVSPKRAGSDSGKDSDVDPDTGMTPCFDLGADVDDLSWDMGIYRPDEPTAIDTVEEPAIATDRIFLPAVNR
jgi:hypothetical protein